MNSLRLPCLALILLAGLKSVSAQGFVNLDFDTTTITPEYFPGGTLYAATIPGWHWNAGSYLNADSVALNSIALDAPAVTLHDTNSPYYSSSFLDIFGGYSVVLQGGTTAGGLVTGNTNGASIYQTGQIPVWA